MHRHALLPTSLVLFCVVFSGCVESDSNITIDGVLVPVPEEDGCTLDPTSEVRLAYGRLDVDTSVELGVLTDYRMAVGIRNQLRPRATSNRSETNGVYVEQAEVTIYTPDRIPLFDTYLVPTSAFIPPSSDSSSPSQGSASFTAIPYERVEDLAGIVTRDEQNYVPPQDILVGVRLLGRTQGDTEIETNEFLFPITLCSGIDRACVFTCGAGGAICGGYLGQDGAQGVSCETEAE